MTDPINNSTSSRGSRFQDSTAAADNAAQKTLDTAADKILKVKTTGSLGLTLETAFCDGNLARNFPKLKAEADIFARLIDPKLIDAQNRQFVFGPYATLDASGNLDQKKVITNVSQGTEDPYTGDIPIIEEKERILSFEKAHITADLGIKAEQELLPQATSENTKTLQPSLMLSYWLPISAFGAINDQDSQYALPANTEAIDYYSNLWIGTRPGASLTWTQPVNNLPLEISMSNTIGLLWGNAWYTTPANNSGFVFQEENKVKASWEFLTGLTVALRNTLKIDSYDWTRTDLSEKVSLGVAYDLLSEFKIDVRPLSYEYGASYTAKSEPYNGLSKLGGSLEATFDLNKTTEFTLGANWVYTAIDKAAVDTPQTKPLTIYAGIKIK